MTTIILGDGPMGRAIADAAARPRRAGHDPRPPADGPAPGRRVRRRRRWWSMPREATPSPANVAAALDAGVRHFVIATTGWAADRADVDAALRERGAAAVAASNFSLGVALFARLVEAATDLFGAVDAFDPYLVEWHRRTKADRPSGTALDLARRLAVRHPRLASPDDLETVSIRAGAARDASRGLRRAPARRSSSGSPRGTGRPTRPACWLPPTGCGRATRARPPSLRPRRRRPHPTASRSRPDRRPADPKETSHDPLHDRRHPTRPARPYDRAAPSCAAPSPPSSRRSRRRRAR